MQYYSCYGNKYYEIKMCDLEPFSKIRSQLLVALNNLRAQYIFEHSTIKVLLEVHT